MRISRQKSFAHQIDGILRQRIATGAYTPGSQLPSETALVGEFRVSRATVRSALNRLASEGLIVRRQGQGTFVNARVEKGDTRVGGMVEYTQLIARNGYAPAIRLLSMKVRPCEAPEGHALGLEPGAEVLSLERLFLADEDPVILASNAIPLATLQQLDMAQVDGTLPLGRFLEQYGRASIAYAMLDIGAVQVKGADATLLKLAPGRALLKIDAVFYDQDDRPLACGRSTYDDRRLQLRFIQSWS